MVKFGNFNIFLQIKAITLGLSELNKNIILVNVIEGMS